MAELRSTKKKKMVVENDDMMLSPAAMNGKPRTDVFNEQKRVQTLFLLGTETVSNDSSSFLFFSLYFFSLSGRKSFLCSC
jgi:hypothetical protein